MLIRDQFGKEHAVNEIEQNLNRISYTPTMDRRRRVLLGEYSTMEKAQHVFSEIYIANNKRIKEYRMPQDSEVDISK